MSKSKYEVMTRLLGGSGMSVGSVVELTDNQANSPLYRSRVRKIAVQVQESKPVLTPSIDRKETIAARLTELGIEFDKRKGEDALAALLPSGELRALFK